MSGWIFEQLSAARGGTGMALDRPLRVVMHTTEMLADPARWIPQWQYPSHIVADPKRRTIYQCVSLDEAAKALWNEPGGVQTNVRGALQIEVNMLAVTGAADRPDLTEDEYKWLAEEVLAPVCQWAESNGSPINLSWVPEPGAIGNSARVDAPQRMDFDTWNVFDGLCSHRHVPENDHWDTGLLDLLKLAIYTRTKLYSVTEEVPPLDPSVPPDPVKQVTPKDEDDMFVHRPTVRGEKYNNGTVYDFTYVPQSGATLGPSGAKLVMLHIRTPNVTIPDGAHVTVFEGNGAKQTVLPLTPGTTSYEVQAFGLLSVVSPDYVGDLICEVHEQLYYR